MVTECDLGSLGRSRKAKLRQASTVDHRRGDKSSGYSIGKKTINCPGTKNPVRRGLQMSQRAAISAQTPSIIYAIFRWLKDTAFKVLCASLVIAHIWVQITGLSITSWVLPGLPVANPRVENDKPSYQYRADCNLSLKQMKRARACLAHLVPPGHFDQG